MNDQQQIDEIFQRIAGDLSMIADRKLEIRPAVVQRASVRVAATTGVHISFKLGFQHAGRILHGALLVPLPDAQALASYLMMLPEENVPAKRAQTTLDGVTKEALLELGNFVGGAADAALHGLGLDPIRVRSESCQGVKPGVRPAFVHAEGEPLVVGRAQAQLGPWPACEWILQLPELAPQALSSGAAA